MNKFWNVVKEKATDLWDKFTDGIAAFTRWCVDNKELAITLSVSVLGIVKQVLKIAANRRDESYRNRRFYDRRTDRWCYARKNLTKNQQRIIEERYQDGETYRSILDSMGLLK